MKRDEFTKLIRLLSAENIPFEIDSFIINEFGYDKAYPRICCPSVRRSVVDAISHFNTPGGPYGFLYVRGSRNPDKYNYAAGWMTAERAIQYFREK